MWDNNRLKKILRSSAPLSYVIPLILLFIFVLIQPHSIWFAIVSLIPGVYALSFALIYGEMQSAERVSGTYRGLKQ